ncbi:hypothetical protein B0H16DRAFT_1461930 [Mycena metata]|uniref:Uncharacterized protein n=1 Tax=Mycena metata TaxID=1033252 RepID=A0AAD7IRM6_9AGAR|nr:hypothetical protein B0H16DRAFT_1461930 [Mycena metata]
MLGLNQSSPVFTFATTAEEVATVTKRSSCKNAPLGFETRRAQGYDDHRSVFPTHVGLNFEALRRVALLLSLRRPQRSTPILDRFIIDSSPCAISQVLINNTATAFKCFTLTVNNLESQIAAAHVGPFLFTKLLTPKLVAVALN